MSAVVSQHDICPVCLGTGLDIGNAELVFLLELICLSHHVLGERSLNVSSSCVLAANIDCRHLLGRVGCQKQQPTLTPNCYQLIPDDTGLSVL